MIQQFKVLFTYEQDDETGEVKVINREVIHDDLPKAKKKTSTPKKSKADENTENGEKLIGLNSLVNNKLK
jgi:hypothetical protein